MSTQIPQDPLHMPEEAFLAWLQESLARALAALRG